MTSSRLGSTWSFLVAFIRARWGYRFKSRAALLAWQKRRIDRYLQGPLAATSYYSRRNRHRLEDLPSVDKQQMLAHFADFNPYRITLEGAEEVALKAEAQRNFRQNLPGSITVGLSSGTSGRRGVFLVSARERALWAGTILARVLDSRSLLRVLTPFSPPLRIALFLRANSNLYGAVQSRRVDFVFCDLLRPMPELLELLRGSPPDVLVAPASVLRVLAEAQRAGALDLRPQQIISVAEVLEPDDEEVIAQAWGRRPAQIYQCTEGLLGQSCEHGSVHLNEEFVHFEPQWLDATHERFTPLITDFTRTTQIFARYRLDDVLRLNPLPCPCGRMTLRLAAIEGRSDDVLWLSHRESFELQPVFPDVVRRAVAVSKPEVADYRIEQHGDTWRLRVRAVAGEVDPRGAVATELGQLCLRFNWQAPKFEFLPWIEGAPDAKRRRIRCVARPREENVCAS